MVYTRRAIKNITSSSNEKDVALQATIQVFAPEHQGPVYEMELPFYDPELQEPFWVGFCLRGGQGFNKNGLSSADPNSLFKTRP